MRMTETDDFPDTRSEAAIPNEKKEKKEQKELSQGDNDVKDKSVTGETL